MYSTSGVAMVLEGGEYSTALAVILGPGRCSKLVVGDDYGLVSINLIRDWGNGESFSSVHRDTKYECRIQRTSR